MKLSDVTVVRIYTTEKAPQIKKVIEALKKQFELRGITVFRGVSGYGETGEHGVSWADLSFDLPLVIEFFDENTKALAALNYLATQIKSEHILTWQAQTNHQEET
jgi:PII-like signaling protein